MKAEKQIIVKIELVGDEVTLFQEILLKMLAVETTISPNVMRMLNDEQLKFLENLEKNIRWITGL